MYDEGNESPPRWHMTTAWIPYVHEGILMERFTFWKYGGFEVFPLLGERFMAWKYGFEVSLGMFWVGMPYALGRLVTVWNFRMWHSAPTIMAIVAAHYQSRRLLCPRLKRFLQRIEIPDHMGGEGMEAFENKIKCKQFIGV